MAERESEITLQTLDRKMDTSVGRLATWLDGVDKRFDQASTQLDGVGTWCDQVLAKLDGVDTRLDQIDARLERLDAKIDVKTDEAKRHALVLFEATRSEIRHIVETVGSINENLDRSRDPNSGVEGDVEFLKIAVRGLDRRVVSLEDEPGS